MSLAAFAIRYKRNKRRLTPPPPSDDDHVDLALRPLAKVKEERRRVIPVSKPILAPSLSLGKYLARQAKAAGGTHQLMAEAEDESADEAEVSSDFRCRLEVFPGVCYKTFTCIFELLIYSQSSFWPSN